MTSDEAISRGRIHVEKGGVSAVLTAAHLRGGGDNNQLLVYDWCVGKRVTDDSGNDLDLADCVRKGIVDEVTAKRLITDAIHRASTVQLRTGVEGMDEEGIDARSMKEFVQTSAGRNGAEGASNDLIKSVYDGMASRVDPDATHHIGLESRELDGRERNDSSVGELVTDEMLASRDPLFVDRVRSNGLSPTATDGRNGSNTDGMTFEEGLARGLVDARNKIFTEPGTGGVMPLDVALKTKRLTLPPSTDVKVTDSVS